MPMLIDRTYGRLWSALKVETRSKESLLGNILVGQFFLQTEDGEFVAAEPGQDVGVPEGFAQHFRRVAPRSIRSPSLCPSTSLTTFLCRRDRRTKTPLDGGVGRI